MAERRTRKLGPGGKRKRPQGTPVLKDLEDETDPLIRKKKRTGMESKDGGLSALEKLESLAEELRGMGLRLRKSQKIVEELYPSHQKMEENDENEEDEGEDEE